MAFLKKEPEKKTEREKVEERREEVLSRGRKFKYPLQAAKHRIVAITIAISVLALLILTGAFYVLLYKTNSTNELVYRITQVLPVSVAKIDDEKVRYSDYLLLYRSSITPIEKQGTLEKDDDVNSMLSYYKRQSLTSAEDYAYAMKLADELGISVSKDEVEEAVLKNRTAGGVERSEETFIRVLQDNFGLSLPEYRRIIYLSLVSEKVSEKIDENADTIAKTVEQRISEGKSLKDIASELGDKVNYEETGGLIDKMNIDGGRADMAMTLEKGKTSGRFISNSGDGYYFVTLNDKTESTVDYSSLQIPFTELKTRLEKVRSENKVDERIKLEESTADPTANSQNSQKTGGSDVQK